MTPKTLLLRQVNPNWIREGRITSQVFKPMPGDKKQLSVYDGDQITAQEAYRHYTRKLNLSSVGVMAVNVAECKQQDLPVKPDPQPLFPEHAVIDFQNHSKRKDIETKAKCLRDAAQRRDWQYQADTAGVD